ncbi:MAG: amidase [Alphaproteobacteria bacterium]
MREGERPSDLSATAAVRAIAGGRLSAEALVHDCLARIAEREETVHAWVALDPDRAIEAARALDARPSHAPLHGVPVGIKDIYDTAAFPTGYGSPIHRDRRPDADAGVVAAMRAGGAVVLGKTVTTEFACFHPGSTANPANPAHTPGGSSSGSAAAVADRHVPLALGSQTVGSVIRPASFCGVVGMKFTQGRIGLDGVMALAPSFDSAGVLCRQAEDLFLAHAALTRSADRRPPAPARPRLGVVRTPHWDLVDEASRDNLAAIHRRLAAAGAEIQPLDLPPDLDAAREIHRVIFHAEALAARAAEWAGHRDMISPKLRALLADAETLTPAEVVAARAAAASLRMRFDEITRGLDAVLAPSAPGEAPEGLDYTGDPSLNGMWTLLQGPLIHVPHGRGPMGLPLGVQLVGRRGEDLSLIQLADWTQRALG